MTHLCVSLQFHRSSLDLIHADTLLLSASVEGGIVKIHQVLYLVITKFATGCMPVDLGKLLYQGSSIVAGVRIFFQ